MPILYPQYFWPADLAVIYPMPVGLSIWEVLGALLLLLAISAGGGGWRRRPYLVVGWCWFLGILVPVVGVIQGTPAGVCRPLHLSDRSSGLFIAAAWGLAAAVRSSATGRRLASVACGRAGCRLLAFAAVPVGRRLLEGQLHRSFGRALAVNPGNWLAENNLGLSLVRQAQGRLRGSPEHLSAGRGDQAELRRTASSTSRVFVYAERRGRGRSRRTSTGRIVRDAGRLDQERPLQPRHASCSSRAGRTGGRPAACRRRCGCSRPTRWPARTWGSRFGGRPPSARPADDSRGVLAILDKTLHPTENRRGGNNRGLP